MHVLLFQDSPEIAEKSLFLIETKYFGTVTLVKTAAEAVKALEDSSKPIDFMVVDCLKISLIGENKFWELTGKTKSLLTENSTPPDILNSKNDNFKIVKRASLVESMTRVFDTLVKLAPPKADKKGASFGRIKTELLLAFAPLKGDIYIRLSEDKFVKIFNEGDVFKAEDLQKYTVKKGVDYFYIPREQCGEFAKRYMEELVKLLSSSSDGQVTPTTIEQGNDVVKQLYKNLGFTKEVQEIAKSQALLTVKTVGKSPDINAFMEKIQNLKGSYLSNHSTYTAYLCCAIANVMDWTSNSTFYKLTLASLLHDITLDSDELAAIKSLPELEELKGKFKPEEINAYKEHPKVISEMVACMDGLPPDVDRIILQHHEFADGTGFPNKLNHKLISSLGALFIISHDMAQVTLKQGSAFNLRNYLKDVREKYSQGNFRKIMINLEKLEIP
ncbi:MAG: HD domain-containing phosphohydrolase [Bdellovibrionia bacterium]